jgi:hypothetical protein
LKRADEKYVTERAYDNPRFVEDLVRGVASRLAVRRPLRAFTVEAENFESIHNHSAYARIARLVIGSGRAAQPASATTGACDTRHSSTRVPSSTTRFAAG